MTGMRRPFFSTLSVCSVLIGCGSSITEGESNSIYVDDAALQYCIDTQAPIQHWNTVDDITVLSCDFSGKDFTSIDLNDTNALEQIVLKSDNITEIKISPSLLVLAFEAPVSSFNPPSNSVLQRLTLNSGLTDHPIIWDKADLDISSLISLRYLDIRNYNLGRLLPLSNHTQLSSLVLNNAYVDIQLNAPESLKELIINDTWGLFYISPTDHLENLTVTYKSENNCNNDIYDFTSLTGLTVENCSSQTFDLSGVPSLLSLDISDSSLEEINLSYTTKITDLKLRDNRLNKIDLTPFSGMSKRYFDARDNNFYMDYVEQLRVEAEAIFEQTEL